MGEMRWRGVHRVWPVTVLRMPTWGLWASVGGDPHHGHWWALRLGPWLFLGGRGFYDA
jgi:hypothetical protein